MGAALPPGAGKSQSKESKRTQSFAVRICADRDHANFANIARHYLGLCTTLFSATKTGAHQAEHRATAGREPEARTSCLNTRLNHVNYHLMQPYHG